MSESEQYVTECAPVEVVLHALNGGQVEYWDAERAAKEMPDSKFGPMIPSGWVQDITHPKEWVPFRVYRIMEEDRIIPKVKQCLITECLRAVVPVDIRNHMSEVTAALEKEFSVIIVAGFDFPSRQNTMHWGARIEHNEKDAHVQLYGHNGLELFLDTLREGCVQVQENASTAEDLFIKVPKKDLKELLSGYKETVDALMDTCGDIYSAQMRPSFDKHLGQLSFIQSLQERLRK